MTQYYYTYTYSALRDRRKKDLPENRCIRLVKSEYFDSLAETKEVIRLERLSNFKIFKVELIEEAA